MNKIVNLLFIFLSLNTWAEITDPHKTTDAEPVAIQAKTNAVTCCINKNTGYPVTAKKSSNCEKVCKALGQSATYPHLKNVRCGKNKKTGNPVSIWIYDGQKKETMCNNACKNICEK